MLHDFQALITGDLGGGSGLSPPVPWAAVGQQLYWGDSPGCPRAPSSLAHTSSLAVGGTLRTSPNVEAASGPVSLTSRQETPVFPDRHVQV